MGGNTNLRPIVPEAYGADGRSDEWSRPGGSTELGWAEDSVRRYTALAVFGALVLAESLLLASLLTGSGDAGWELAGAGLGMFAAILPAILWGYTEIGVALAGATATDVGVGILGPFNRFPAHFHELSPPPGPAMQLVALVAFQAIGAATFLVGLTLAIRAVRRDRAEDR